MAYREAPEPRGPGISAAATWYAVALLTLMNLVNYIDRFSLPAVAESVQRDIPMSDTQLGFALSSFVMVYMLAAPVFGRLGDRRSRKALLAVGVAVWSVATAAAAYAHTYRQLLLARSAVGIGEAAYATLAPSLISDYFPAKTRGKVMSLFYIAIPVGSALGYVLSGLLTEHFGWRSAFLAVGLPGLALAALALTIREPERGRFDDGELPEQEPLGPTLKKLARNREYALTVAGYTLYTFALGGLAVWMPKYLISVRGVSMLTANGVFGTLTVVGGLVGTIVGGAIAEALKGRVKHPYLWLSGVTCLLATPATIFAFSLGNQRAMWAAVFVAELFAFASTGPVNTVLLNSVPATMRTLAFAVSILCSHLLGDAISPTLIGLASDATGSLGKAVLLVPVTFALGGIVWLYAQRTLPEAK